MMRRNGESPEEYLDRIPSFAREKSSLETIRKFLSGLSNPDRCFPVIHVAGTNGKGSVCAMITSCLREAGILTGTFISPHLVDIRERFLVNGEMVEKDAFDRAFETVFEASVRWQERGGVHPTYFEFLFYMAMVLFREAGVSAAVLETGMGGRFDVTNAVEKPIVSVITSISIDHTAFLGKTVEEIAWHKAGIIKRGCPVVYDGGCAKQVIENTATSMESPAEEVSEVPFTFRDGAIRISVPFDGEPIDLTVPFAAPYQAENAALAVRALERSGLPVTAEQIREGIKKTIWPARMEQILPGIYLDGAHNEDGIREFLKAACMICENRRDRAGRVWLIFAVAADKDYREMLSEIGETLKPDFCILTQMDSYRALSLPELHRTAEEMLGNGTEIKCLETTAEAVRRLLSEKREEDLAFIAGSLYLAGEVKAVVAEMTAGKDKHD